MKTQNLGKYIDLSSELEKFWNMNMTLISIVFGATGIILKNLEKRRVER